MRYWETLDTVVRDGFEIVIDITPEDSGLEGHFDDSIDPDTGKPYYDLKEMYRQLETGHLSWFMLRARAFFEGHEFGSAVIGGMLYETNKIDDVWSDGVAEDAIHMAVEEAQKEFGRIKSRMIAMEA